MATDAGHCKSLEANPSTTRPSKILFAPHEPGALRASTRHLQQIVLIARICLASLERKRTHPSAHGFQIVAHRFWSAEKHSGLLDLLVTCSDTGQEPVEIRTAVLLLERTLIVRRLRIVERETGRYAHEWERAIA